tara:strand:+ start:3866 stop:4462 length:597 start_codon:yes stop_codon:yes gene_type:complete
MDTVENIKGAIECGEVLTVKYHGGSKPGTIRQIHPLHILDDGKVRVKCLSTNSNKVFMLSKIELVDDSLRNSANTWDKIQPKTYSSIEDVYEEHSAALIKMGWHVVLNNEATDKMSIEIYTHFKNGKLRKKPAGILSFTEFDTEYCCDSDKFVKSSNKRARPYSCFSPDGNNGSFSSLVKCADKFLLGAKLAAPNKHI